MRSDLKRLRRDSDAGTAAPVGRSRNWWLVLAAVAIVAILVWQLPSLLRRGDVGPTGDRRTLVVLPFANIGGDPEQEFFSDGMTEEVRGVLGAANPDRLRVIARTSSMQFQEGAVSIRAIRDALGVTHVVEGSVRRQGSVVRISAKLIDASDETQIWTNSFDGTLDDIFALQSRVANQIAEALAVNLLPGAVAVGRDYAPDPRAYEEYLSGRFWDYKGTQEGYQKAIAHYEQAVAIDPGFALVWASLSQTSSTLASWTTLSPIELLVRAEEAMNKAFELDPDLPDAHVARAYYQLLGQWEWQDADATFERALTMNPSNPGMAHHWHGHYLSFAGRNQDALDAFAAALRIDPLSALHRSCLGLTQIAAGDLDLAERSLEQALERAPQLPIAHSWLGLLRERQGKLEEAVAAWQEASEFGGGVGLFTGPLGYGYGRLGRVEEARDLLGGLLATEDGEYVAALNIARVYAGIGEIDRAFEQLEIAVEKREPWILGLRIGPGFDTLHDDPRYVDLLRRIGVDP